MSRIKKGGEDEKSAEQGLVCFDCDRLLLQTTGAVC